MWKFFFPLPEFHCCTLVVMVRAVEGYVEVGEVRAGGKKGMVTPSDGGAFFPFQIFTVAVWPVHMSDRTGRVCFRSLHASLNLVSIFEVSFNGGGGTSGKGWRMAHSE